MVLEKYLGPTIDVGTSLVDKILKSNGEVLHILTYRALLSEKVESI